VIKEICSWLPPGWDGREVILISVCSFCGGQHTDTNIYSILLFLVSQVVAKIQL